MKQVRASIWQSLPIGSMPSCLVRGGEDAIKESKVNISSEKSLQEQVLDAVEAGNWLKLYQLLELARSMLVSSSGDQVIAILQVNTAEDDLVMRCRDFVTEVSQRTPTDLWIRLTTTSWIVIKVRAGTNSDMVWQWSLDSIDIEILGRWVRQGFDKEIFTFIPPAQVMTYEPGARQVQVSLKPPYPYITIPVLMAIVYNLILLATGTPLGDLWMPTLTFVLGGMLVELFRRARNQ